MNREIIKKRLMDELGQKIIEENASMADHTSFKTGGNAALLLTPQTIEDLKKGLQILTEENCPHMVLGNGSNILVRDGGYEGVILKIGDAFDFVKQEEDCLICGASTLLSVVAKAALKASLTGLEFASGIPGSMGGAVFMNAGAYDGELKQVLKEARLISKDGSREFSMTAAELVMGYRHTRLHETGDVVIEAVLQLEKGDKEAIRSRMAELAARRNEKQPVTFPSAGSFFKRPEGYFAGKLIQDAGLKGLSVGGAQVSELHSGFIINTGGATATDILQLMEIVRATVLDRFGVKLEPEVRIIGE
ncbi:MAG: UDP-N-acetylmuramate dehydrogenase [Bacillota bacterium]|nr:UDP-N-acetylmuramate dehydrogenase [Bacillota bacterium]